MNPNRLRRDRRRRPDGGGARILPRPLIGALIALAALIVIAPNASAAQRVITSSGPMTNIYLNDSLACQADYSGDTHPVFYSGTDPGACGTFLSTGGVSYGPSVPAGTARTAYTPVSQTAVTGAGTSADPYRVVTTVNVPTTNLKITQTDRYIVGQQVYRTDVAVTNTSGSGAAVPATLYHAADCYLEGSDSGNGFHDSTTGGIYCSANPNNSPAGRVEGFVPASAGSHFVESGYGTVWAAIDAAGTQLPGTCDCTTFQDNGAGLSWSLSVPAHTTLTRSLITALSPTGTIPDTTPPRTTISTVPGATSDPTPTFDFGSSEGGSTFECSIDTGTPQFVPCSGPGASHTSPTPLAPGSYFFRVRATDPAANTDPTPVIRSFDVLGSGPPIFKKRANASPVSGVVKVKLPGTKKFVLLQNKGLIPIGTIIDARKGRVHIVSSDGKGGARHVDFFEGMFKLRQGKATRGYTDAKLVGPLACGKGRATAARKGRRGRHLWGKGKGHHSSTGKNSSGSVRGTWWLVWDRCDGSTLTFVKRGEVLVRDFRTGRKVLLHKGQSYVAGPKRKH